MKTTNSLPGYSNARRILPLLVIAVALAVPSWLWGQDCQQAITSVNVTPGSVIALASGPAGSVSGTVNCPIGINGTVIPITITPSDGVLGCGGAGVQAGTNYGTFGCTAVQGSGSYTLTATLNNTTGNASVTVTPLEASIAVSPTTLVGGSGETATVTVTTNAPVRSVSPYIGQFYNTISNTCNNVSGSFDSQIYPGNSTTTTTMGAAAVSTPTLCSFTVQNWIWGGPTVSGSVMVLPASSGTPPAQVPAVNTVCKE